MDVVAHELAHGYTEKSSGLIYSFQSGGLNEAYSDILGTIIEFHVNDATDTPDFLIGEVYVFFLPWRVDSSAGSCPLVEPIVISFLCFRCRMEGTNGVLRYMENPPLDGSSIGSVRVNPALVHLIGLTRRLTHIPFSIV